MSPPITVLAVLSSLIMAGCGGLDGPKNLPQNPGEGRRILVAQDHSPGYFRDLFESLTAQTSLDDESAVETLLVTFERRTADPGTLPPLGRSARDTLDGLLTLGLHSVQATESTPPIARKIGNGILWMSLGLDPVLAAFNRDGGDAEITTPGAAALASAAQRALQVAADDSPVICARVDYTTGASFDPGEPEVAWIEGGCEEDEWVEEYCAGDEWVDGECFEEWVPEECTGGHWVDRGYYEYYCYDEYDCRYIWREYWVYVDGYCEDGYWNQWCDSGHWESGPCDDGYWLDGECEEGHFEYVYPDGTWDFSALTVPEDCGDVRPRQYTIAITAARVLAAKAYDDLTAEWRSALDSLLAVASLDTPDEAIYDAALQIIAAAAARLSE